IPSLHYTGFPDAAKVIGCSAQKTRRKIGSCDIEGYINFPRPPPFPVQPALQTSAYTVEAPSLITNSEGGHLYKLSIAFQGCRGPRARHPALPRRNARFHQSTAIIYGKDRPARTW